MDISVIDLIRDFEKYQTSIIGALGFIGVIITIVVNAKLARNQHERELSLEAAAIRTTLIVELTNLKNSYEDRVRTSGKHGGSILIPKYVSDKAYCQLLPRLGLLTPKELELVMTAYQLAGELPIRLGLLSNSDSSSWPGYVAVDSSDIPEMVQMHKNFLKNFDSALSVIKQNMQK